MTIQKLVRMGDERLIKKSSVVEDIADSKIQQVIDDLIESMRHYGGVGIAGPQIGYFMRIFVFEIDSNPRYPGQPSVPLTVLINPEIEVQTDQREYGWEGCLSVPGYRGLVPRYTHIRYRGYDRSGVLVEREAEGFHARVVQHENDHLDGILFPMRVEDMRDFGCDDMLWERITGESYPESLKQQLREHWDL